MATEGTDALSEIGDWLEGLGLSQYAATFRENDVDLDILVELTDEDLKELGLSLGHRRRVLRAINELRGPGAAEEAETPASWSAPEHAAADDVPDEKAGDEVSGDEEAGDEEAGDEEAGEAFLDGRPTFAILVVELRNLTELSRTVHHLHLSQLQDEFRQAWSEARERWHGIHVNDHASKFVAYFGPAGGPSQSATHAICAAQEVMSRFRQLAEKISGVGDPPPRTFWTCCIGIDCGQVPGETENGDLRDLMAEDANGSAPSQRSARIASLNESMAAVTVSARLLTEIADNDTIVVSARARTLLQEDFKLARLPASGVDVTAYVLAEDEPRRPTVAAPGAMESPLFNPSAPKVRGEVRAEPRTEPSLGTPLPSAYNADRPGGGPGGGPVGGQASTIRMLEEEKPGIGVWLSPLAIFFSVILVGLPILAFVFDVDFLVSLFEFLQGLIA